MSYRLLDIGERICHGDEIEIGGRWFKATNSVGRKISKSGLWSHGSARRPLKTAERRKTVRAKRPVQQRKGDNFSYCGLVDCRSNKNELCNVKCCRYVRRKTTPVA